MYKAEVWCYVLACQGKLRREDEIWTEMWKRWRSEYSEFWGKGVAGNACTWCWSQVANSLVACLIWGTARKLVRMEPGKEGRRNEIRERLGGGQIIPVLGSIVIPLDTSPHEMEYPKGAWEKHKRSASSDLCGTSRTQHQQQRQGDLRLLRYTWWELMLTPSSKEWSAFGCILIIGPTALTNRWALRRGNQRWLQGFLS